MIPTIFPSSLDICDNYDALLLDAYGVFWNGNAAGLIPGAKQAMEKLKNKNKVIGILSNATQPSEKEITKLQKHGLIQGIHYDFLLTSGEVAKNIFLNNQLPFQTPNNKFYLFGGIHPHYPSPLILFENSQYQHTENLKEADFIYISIPHINGENQTDPFVFEEKIQKIKEHNLPMVCANPDEFAHEGKPPVAVVRQGSIAKIYNNIGGEVFYIGKPYSPAYIEAMKFFNKHSIYDLKKILMIGDTPATDIEGANRFGLDSALITKHGNMKDQITKNGRNKAILSLKDVLKPSYFIEEL
ncbi:MAG TPA: TIGR01459 family HAD-type hydrolase [Chlamydiales bacterium]|nr:TIGR01459 family HAD-type hydrolase [Chlamydiales bacterium]